MRHFRWLLTARRALLLALPLAIFATLLFSTYASAHAILIRSDPAKGAVLATAPSQIRLWFSESLNPTFSTVYVVKAASSASLVQDDVKLHVDSGNAHVSSSDNKEMDISLKANLPSAVYAVLYRTQSADDGHILHGSFLFTVAAANGAVPTFNGQLPEQDIQGPGSTGQLDAPTVLSFIMTTLVDLGAVFWMGAQLWFMFVAQLNESTDQFQQTIAQKSEQRFWRRFSLPSLGLLFLANIGVLVGQALSITGSQVGLALAPQLLFGLVSQGQFGTYWIVREVVILLAILLTGYLLIVKSVPKRMRAVVSWANFVLGLALLAAITLSGHAAATKQDVVVYAILSDFLHLLAASLWIGGMLYIALIYLPVLRSNTSLEQARSLLQILPRYSPLAITGVVIMGVSGPFNATTRMDSWDQLLSTAYGRTLLIKVLLVGALLVTSSVHVLLFRPRLAKDYRKYNKATEASRGMGIEGADNPVVFSSSEVKSLEERVVKQTRRLRDTLRWEPLLGVAVLLCTGLLAAFSGTLQPVTTTSAPAIQQRTTQAKPLAATLETTDKQFKINVSVSPNNFGPNTFTATVMDSKGVIVPNNSVGVSFYTTMLDMDMGTSSINLQPDGKGHFSATDELTMGGNWQLRVEVRTPDGNTHGATIKFATNS